MRSVSFRALWSGFIILCLTAFAVCGEAAYSSQGPSEANATLEALGKEGGPSRETRPSLYPEENEHQASRRGPSSANVNIREEFSFDSRQNIDSFLGHVENPVAPLPQDGVLEENRGVSDTGIEDSVRF